MTRPTGIPPLRRVRIVRVTVLPEERVDAEVRTDRPWVTIVWNDPINLMDYVTHVFMTHFGYSKEKATALMLEVHNDGRSTVSAGDRESMERDVAAMHSYGLWATLAKDS
ncbi:MAG: ATP-dependent Clp protease adapter ClpS [Actinobacteria bacterium]|nr:ATP-dependent Clp protease adapter ClpS [Actinomycetota bacterium]